MCSWRHLHRHEQSPSTPGHISLKKRIPPRSSPNRESSFRIHFDNERFVETAPCTTLLPEIHAESLFRRVSESHHFEKVDAVRHEKSPIASFKRDQKDLLNSVQLSRITEIRYLSWINGLVFIYITCLFRITKSLKNKHCSEYFEQNLY